MKLSSFEGNNLLIITQSNHGAAQGNCAFDFGWQGTPTVSKNIYAPCDGEVTDVWHTAGNDCYFNFANTGFFIQFVHDEPLRKGEFKRGDLLGASVKDHHHVAIQVNGGWHWIFDYIDRGTQLYWWTYPNKDSKWAQWNTYSNDLQLPGDLPPVDPCLVEKAQIVQLQKENTDLREKINKAIADLS